MASLIPDEFWEELEVTGFFAEMRPTTPRYDRLRPLRPMPWEDPDDPFAGLYVYDSRPAWEKMDPTAGVPVWEALYHFVDMEKAARLFELDYEGYGNRDYWDPDWSAEEAKTFRLNSMRCWRLWLELKGKLLGRLQRGEVVARGFSNQAPLDEPRRSINPERWLDLKLDVRNATASGPGIEVTRILIFPGKPVAAARAGKRRRRARFSPARLRAWYQARIKECQQAGRIPSREDDVLEAQAAFADVPRSQVWALRQELAPPLWTRKGRRPSSRTKS